LIMAWKSWMATAREPTLSILAIGAFGCVA
jgi:hypothetical protein